MKIRSCGLDSSAGCTFPKEVARQPRQNWSQECVEVGRGVERSCKWALAQQNQLEEELLLLLSAPLLAPNPALFFVQERMSKLRLGQDLHVVCQNKHPWGFWKQCWGQRSEVTGAIQGRLYGHFLESYPSSFTRQCYHSWGKWNSSSWQPTE